MTNIQNKLERYLNEHYVQNPKLTFRSYVMKRMEELVKTAGKEHVIYQRGNIDRRLHNKLKHTTDDYQPHKTTALAYCLALGLNSIEAEELLYLAGYHFEEGSLTDQIVKCCLEEGVYSADVVNNEICYFAEIYGLKKVELIGSVVREIKDTSK